MDLSIIITIILINTIIALLLFNIIAEQQSKMIQAQNEFNKKTLELFKHLCKEQIELYSEIYDLKLKTYAKEMEEKKDENVL